MALTDLFSSIADAIREKDGTTAEITASDFPDRIRAVPTSETVTPINIYMVNPSGPIYITGNSCKLDTSKFVAKVTFSNGKSVDIGGQSLTTSPANGSKLTVGTTTITVSYTLNKKTVTAYSTIILTASSYDILGVMTDFSVSKTKMTRLTTSNDPNYLVTKNITTEPVSAVALGAGSSPFDSIPPWSEMTTTVKLNTSDVMVHVPSFHYRIIIDGSKTYYYISKNCFDGSMKHPGSDVYVGRYPCNSSYRSVTGSSPTRGKAMSVFRSGIQSVNSAYGLLTFRTYHAIQLLYLVEYANWDVSNTIGMGCDNISTTTGTTDDMKYHTGTRASSKSVSGSVQYRRIENLWLNGLEALDGIYYHNGSLYYKDGAPYGNSKGGYNQIQMKSGIPIHNHTTLIHGFVQPIDSDMSWIIFPSNTTSNAFSLEDQVYVSSSDDTYVLFAGGYPGQGIRGGFNNYYIYRTPTESTTNNYCCRIQFPA